MQADDEQTFNADKFRELMLYIADRSVEDPHFGSTKLNKELFYSDFLAYGLLGRSITGATYQRLPWGPAPKELLQVRRSLLSSGEARIENARRFNYPQKRLIAERPANLSLLSAAEKKIVDDVIRALRDKSATDVTELSHREAAWDLAHDREEIPYTAVYLSSRPLTASDTRRGQELAQRLAS